MISVKEAYLHTINELKAIYGEREAQSLARILFEDAFSIYQFNQQTSFSQKQLLAEYLKALKEGIPLQYVLGNADFYGLKFKVSSAVLIPRQETEELVHWILEEHSNNSTLKVLDIGTGSGCIPISLKKNRPSWEVHGVDISREALEVAEANAASNGVEVHFDEQNILEVPILEGQWDIIVSNPPYIPKEESILMPEHVLRHEPAIALFVENPDPLLFYRKIADLSKEVLTDKGQLFFELNEFNAREVEKMLLEKGYREVELKKDINGKIRMICANC